MKEVKATELELIEEFEGYHLARHDGRLGIWSIYEGDAMLMDEDCEHLLNPESEGLFSYRVLRLKEEARQLMNEL